MQPIASAINPQFTASPIFQVLCLCLMFVVGAIFGSFLCCQARRLRRREQHQRQLGSRSVCLHCHHQLKWYENLPLLSWCLQKGRCRHCQHPIGLAEILAELLTAIAFTVVAARELIPIFTAGTPLPTAGVTSTGTAAGLASIATSPLAWPIFLTTLIFTTLLIFLAIYDGLYGELPTLPLTFSIICAIMVVVLRYWALFSTSQLSWPLIRASLATPHPLTTPAITLLAGPLLALLILGGLYLVLYLVSHGKWVGDGDWLLAGAIGLALGTPLAALAALFVANFTACVISAPAALKRQTRQIYFGPFLVAAYVLTLALCGIIEL